jgi:cytochrome c551/c552
MRGLFCALVPSVIASVAITLGLADTQAAQQQSPGQTLPATTPAVVPPETPSRIALHADPDVLFKTSGNCMPCHNSLVAPSGEDVSMGASWRASMMANSARDPYWQAAVRREAIDYPSVAADIQDECAICHMPMARATANAAGRKGQVFAHLPVNDHRDDQALLAHDGVGCAMCHQISSEKLGTPESFVGGFVIAGRQSTPRPVFGPFDVEKGLRTIMRSSAEFQPTKGDHIRQSELCATCHTLITKALDPQGQVVGQLPEQMMYLEWKHSAFETEQKSCQSCHMPAVEQDMPITSVLGEPRKGFARHVFVGGNFFMLRLLNRYRLDLGIEAPSHELDASALRTIQNLQSKAAAVSVERAEMSAGRLNIDLAVQNVTGHKLPSGYPSRRAWLHVIVRDRTGREVFESGAITPSGLIQGNDNDADGAKFEPHYAEIRQPDQVQIYESIMADRAGSPTTGLLTAVRYLKDNRLLPRGFDKATAEADIQVVGGAIQDNDFTGGSDRIRYSIETPGSEGPFQIDVELRFQPIGFRWAQNLKPYDAAETQRFVAYYDSMASSSSEMLVRAAAMSR